MRPGVKRSEMGLFIYLNVGRRVVLPFWTLALYRVTNLGKQPGLLLFLSELLAYAENDTLSKYLDTGFDTSTNKYRNKQDA